MGRHRFLHSLIPGSDVGVGLSILECQAAFDGAEDTVHSLLNEKGNEAAYDHATNVTSSSVLKGGSLL